MGKSEDKCAGMKRMYYQEYGDVIVPAHPKEDVNVSGEDKEKKVVKEEKNCNITPFVPLSPRLNQHSSRWDQVERKRYLHKCVLPVQRKASQ